MNKLMAYRVILAIDSSTPIYDYTGRIVKTLVYALMPELASVRGVKGVLSSLIISPPFTIARSEGDLGEPVIPVYERRRVQEDGGKVVWDLKPVRLSGEYIVHIGGEEHIASAIVKRLSELTTPLAIKVGNAIVKYKVEKVIDVTKSIIDKANGISNRVRIYLKSPAQIFNVFAPSKLPKFTPSAVELLMTPYMLANNIYTIDYTTLTNASQVLGQLVETWYSLKTLKPIMVPFKGKKEATLGGHVTYIVEATNEMTINALREVLVATEIVGIGRSRQNGFGTAVLRV